MRYQQRGIIFSDIDGTFLDAHGNLALDPHAFARVREHWRVIWVSSRTAEEVIEFQTRLAHSDDAIGENGAVCICATMAHAALLGTVEPCGGRWTARIAASHSETAAIARRVFAAHGARVRFVDDLSDDELERHSDVITTTARRVRRRRSSVLLADIDTAEPATAVALGELRRAGCTVAHGGRWTSIVRGADKGSSARAWLRSEQTRHGNAPGHDEPLRLHGHHVPGGPRCFAIGNAENDETLLAMANLAFVIRSPSNVSTLALPPGTNAYHLTRAGIAGWIEMLEYLDNDEGATS